MDLEQTWKDLIRQLKSYPNVNASQIDAFFSRVQIQAASPGFVMLTSDNGFIKDWIEKHYMKDIVQALKDLYDVDFNVLIEVDPTATPIQSAPTAPVAATPAPGTAEKAVQGGENSNGNPLQPESAVIGQAGEAGKQQAAAPQQDAVSPQPQTPKENAIPAAGEAPKRAENDPANTDNALTFDSFVIGESNRMAYNMALEVAERPSASELNPLFIYGRSGVGKTHLMCAIRNYILEQYPNLNVCYIDSMELVNKYSEAAIEKSVDKQSFKNFESFFQQADVLLIDDIQGLQSKPGTLNALFRIFNSMIPKGKQFVFSADRAPRNIDLDERYVSRFNSGATIDIQPPDDETKRNIIKGFVKHYRTREGISLDIPDKVLDYIVENSSSNIRELKSAVTNVIFAIKMSGEEGLSETQIKELLGNHFLGGGKRRITIDMVQGAVEDFYGVAHKDLVGSTRKRDIARTRQVAIYLCRELSETTLKNIGEAFNRDHSTVMHSCDMVADRLQEDRNLREELEAIREKIRIQQY